MHPPVLQQLPLIGDKVLQVQQQNTAANLNLFKLLSHCLLIFQEAETFVFHISLCIKPPALDSGSSSV